MTTQYDVVTEDRADYIYCKVAGPGHDLKLFVDSVIPAIELALNSTHKKLFLEDGIEEDWPPLMMEKLVAQLFLAGFDKLFISVYIPVPERQYNTYYAGDVGKNMGMNVEVSINFDTAMKRIHAF